jgi:hypothetical protein
MYKTVLSTNTGKTIETSVSPILLVSHVTLRLQYLLTLRTTTLNSTTEMYYLAINEMNRHIVCLSHVIYPNIFLEFKEILCLQIICLHKLNSVIDAKFFCVKSIRVI